MGGEGGWERMPVSAGPGGRGGGGGGETEKD